MKRYDTILFDMDDTLFNFRRSEREALRKSMMARGLEPTVERLSRYREISEGLWRRFDRGEVSADWLAVERFARFARELNCRADPAVWNAEHAVGISRECWLMPGAEALCGALSAAGCRLFIVTNGLGFSQRSRLAASPVASLFSGIFVSHELGVRKPERAFFQRVFAQAGISDLSRTILVGDNLLTDIQGGVNAEIDSIWFNPACEKPSLPISPTYQIRSLGEVERIILR